MNENELITVLLQAVTRLVKQLSVMYCAKNDRLPCCIVIGIIVLTTSDIIVVDYRDDGKTV